MIASMLLLVAGVPAGWLYIRMLGPPVIPASPAPQGDVYRQLRELGTRIRQATPTSAQQMLSQAEQLLQQPAAVPLDFCKATVAQDNEIGPFNDLRRALIAESSRQESLGRRDEAVKFALAALRLGTMLQRGGNGVHAQVGRVAEAVAILRLAEMRSNLSPQQCHTIISELERADSLRDPVDEIVAREKLWSDLAVRWRHRLQIIIVEESWNDNALPNDFGLKSLRDWNAAIDRLLRTDFAIRAFEQNEGRLPQSLVELTPKYLSVPLPDPFSGEPLRYRPSGGTFLLYSIGRDRKDNGGRTIKPGQKDDGLGYDIEL
jgi:hypothetical protein